MRHCWLSSWLNQSPSDRSGSCLALWIHTVCHETELSLSKTGFYSVARECRRSSCFKGIISWERIVEIIRKWGKRRRVSGTAGAYTVPQTPLHMTLLCLTEYISCLGVKILVLQWSKGNSGTPGLICDIVFLWSSQSVGVIDHWVFLKSAAAKPLPNTRCFWNKHRDKHDKKNGDH